MVIEGGGNPGKVMDEAPKDVEETKEGPHFGDGRGVCQTFHDRERFISDLLLPRAYQVAVVAHRLCEKRALVKLQGNFRCFEHMEYCGDLVQMVFEIF